MDVEFKCIVKALRWSGLRQHIKDLAFLCGVEDVSIEYKGLFCSTFHVSVYGESEKVLAFSDRFKKSIEKYNEEI